MVYTIQLHGIGILSGDMLAIYTHGVTEWFNIARDEFGEQRLIEALRQHFEQLPKALLGSIVDDVQQFRSHQQHDDITFIVATCRGN
jgi:serine phosphatase RsbU (regulator of sigma subunit)